MLISKYLPSQDNGLRFSATEAPTFYRCGICECFHSIKWDGDCRQDNARFFADQLDERYGSSDGPKRKCRSGLNPPVAPSRLILAMALPLGYD